MTNQGSDPDISTAHTRRRFAFSGIEQRVLQRLRKRSIPRDSPVIVGFSGGPDSLCLAAIFARLRQAGHIQPILVHINHGVRLSAQNDAERAAELATLLSLPIEVRSLKPDFAFAHPKTGLEEAMRRERYRLLAESAEHHRCTWIATAHHEQDQVETVLMHLFRGSGLQGMTGMAELSEIEVPWWGGAKENRTQFSLWRPLLRESEREIDEYIASLGLAPIIDESNTVARFRRNAVRHTIVPAIDQVFPAAQKAITRFAELAARDDEYLQSLATEALVILSKGEDSISTTGLLAQPPVIQARILRLWLNQRRTDQTLSFDRTEAILRMARNGVQGKLVEIGSHEFVTLIGDSLCKGSGIELEDIAWSQFPGPRGGVSDTALFEINPGRTQTVGGFRVRFSTEYQEVDPERSVRLPQSLEGKTILLRTLASGDRFANEKRVDDWLRIHRVPVIIRSKLLCLVDVDKERVIWIPGLPMPSPNDSVTSRDSIVVLWETNSDT